MFWTCFLKHIITTEERAAGSDERVFTRNSGVKDGCYVPGSYSHKANLSTRERLRAKQTHLHNALSMMSSSVSHMFESASTPHIYVSSSTLWASYGWSQLAVLHSTHTLTMNVAMRIIQVQHTKFLMIFKSGFTLTTEDWKDKKLDKADVISPNVKAKVALVQFHSSSASHGGPGVTLGLLCISFQGQNTSSIYSCKWFLSVFLNICFIHLNTA